MFVRFCYGRMAGDGVHLPLNRLPDGRFCRSHRKLCSSIVEDLLPKYVHLTRVRAKGSMLSVSSKVSRSTDSKSGSLIELPLQ